MTKTHIAIPKDFAIQPLKEGHIAREKVTCGHCGLSWDDSIPTLWTPVPSGRCPFEYFHVYRVEVKDNEAMSNKAKDNEAMSNKAKDNEAMSNKAKALSKIPFYRTVNVTKVFGGKRPLWHARKEGLNQCGTGNTADNAIADLQRQIRIAISAKKYVKTTANISGNTK